MEFHHRDEGIKIFRISQSGEFHFKNICDIKFKIEDELNKCDVLCSNCHNELHSDINFFNEHKEEIYEKSKTFRIISNKIDKEIVKKMYFEKNMKQIDIVKCFNCSKGTISDIIKKMKKHK